MIALSFDTDLHGIGYPSGNILLGYKGELLIRLLAGLLITLNSREL